MSITCGTLLFAQLSEVLVSLQFMFDKLTRFPYVHGHLTQWKVLEGHKSLLIFNNFCLFFRGKYATQLSL